MFTITIFDLKPGFFLSFSLFSWIIFFNFFYNLYIFTGVCYYRYDLCFRTLTYKLEKKIYVLIYVLIKRTHFINCLLSLVEELNFKPNMKDWIQLMIIGQKLPSHSLTSLPWCFPISSMGWNSLLCLFDSFQFQLGTSFSAGEFDTTSLPFSLFPGLQSLCVCAPVSDSFWLSLGL